MRLLDDCVENIKPLSASATTFREWGRTAKNANWLTTIDNQKSAKVIPVSDNLRISRNDDSKVSLKVGATSHWVVGSTAISLQPLYVQRHLVALFSKQIDTGGAKADTFVGSQFLVGKDPAVNNRLLASATRLELQELEVPAQILATGVNKNVTLTEDFSAARFDLKSVGGLVSAGIERDFRIHVRFANSEVSMKDIGTELFICLNPEAKDGIYKTPPPKNQKVVRAVDIIWRTGGKKSFGQTRWHFWDGNVQVTGAKELTSVESIDELCVKFCNPKHSQEVWADVSLLHSVYSPNLAVANTDKDNSGKVKKISGSTFTEDDFNRFDFDWLFSSKEQKEESLATRLRPKSLHRLTEAQARIVSTSLPVDLLENENGHK